MTPKVKGQGQTLKILKSNISKTLRDREKVSMGVKQEVIYWLSNGENTFDLGSPLKIKSQCQTLKTLESNISKTVRDRKKMSMEVR